MKKILLFLWFGVILTMLSACGQGGQCSSQNNTNISPTVMFDSTNGGVANGESNVSMTPSIVLAFNTPMQPETINVKTILLSTSPITTKLNSVESVTLVPISNIVASSNDTIFSFSPKEPLQPNTKYYLTVTSETKTVSGASVTGQFTFTTGEFIVPTASIIQPSNGSTNISLSPIVQLKFSESVNNVDSTNVTLHAGSTTGSTVSIGSITLGSNNTYTFSPSANLSSNTTYYIVLSSNIIDNYGNALSQTSFSFTTGDFIVPTVEMINPSNNAINTSLSPVIELQFSEAVNNVNGANVTLHSGSATGSTVSIGSITLGSNNTYTFSPSANLSSNTTYYVVLSNGILDNDGNALNQTSFNFTTIDSTPITTSSYAYITNYNDSVTKCSIAANGDLTDCAYTGGTLTRPTGIAISPSKTHAYIITNSEDDPSAVTKCTIEPTDGSLFDCNNAGATDVAYSSAIAINSSGTNAYITNYYSGTVTYCFIDPITANFAGCANSGATFSSPRGVAMNQSGSIAYVTNSNSSIISGCDVGGGSDDMLSNCTSNDFSPLGLTGIAVNSTGNRAFITSTNYNYLLSCPVTGKSISFGGCSFTPNDVLDNPYGVALNADETIAYVVNYSNETVSKCAISGNGTITGCVDSGATNLHGSNSIAILSPPF